MGKWRDFETNAGWWPATYAGGSWTKRGAAAPKAQRQWSQQAEAGPKAQWQWCQQTEAAPQWQWNQNAGRRRRKASPRAPRGRDNPRQVPPREWKWPETDVRGGGRQGEVDVLAKDVQKARQSVDRKAQVLANSIRRTNEFKVSLAGLVTRLADAEKDVEVRRAAHLTAELVLATAERAVDERDGRDGTGVHWNAMDVSWDGEHAERIQRLVASANPDVTWLVAMSQFGATAAAAPTQDDRNIDIAGMACCTQDEGSLMGLLEEADMCEGEERDAKRRQAIGAYHTFHSTRMALSSFGKGHGKAEAPEGHGKAGPYV